MNVVLANVDYRQHLTDEGDQFQVGLEHAGWTLLGAGYQDGVRDVKHLIDRYSPTACVVHDKRDWDPMSAIAFRKDVGFQRVGELARKPFFKAVVVKDAATSVEYQRKFYNEVGAKAAIVYYHPKSVTEFAPWLGTVPLIRTYHSVDADFVRTLDLRALRKRAVVSGATSNTYPLRQLVFLQGQRHGIDGYGHPGYGNKGSKTPSYLQMLAGYRVHVATASRFKFALRKIIESVACGATPVTNLPSYDVLPEIDGALVRIPVMSRLQDVLTAVQHADETWNLEERLAWAEKAWQFYDFRAIGVRLSEQLCSR